MNIELQISDEVYKNLLSKGSRVSGTIALVSPKEGNFNAWKSHQDKREVRKFIKLPHGRASIGKENVRLTLRIDRTETDVMPDFWLTPLFLSRSFTTFTFSIFLFLSLN